MFNVPCPMNKVGVQPQLKEEHRVQGGGAVIGGGVRGRNVRR